MFISLANFWRIHPSLLYGLSLLLGFSLGFSFSLILGLPLLLLYFPVLHPFPLEEQLRQRLISGILICFSAFLFTQMFYIFPTEDQVHGKGRFSISSVNSHTSHFSHSWVYKGELLWFTPDNTTGTSVSHLPCSVLLNAKQERPPADCDYIIHGVLKKTDNNTFILQADKSRSWDVVPNTWNMSEWRLHVKNKVTNHIKHSIGDKSTGSFLAGIATGDFDDRLVAQEFSRFGLQHILAISGFHFAIIAGILGFIVRLFIPINITYYILAVFLAFYFLFLGFSPSIIRACVTIEVFLLGFAFERRSPALNSLGTAMIITLLWNPMSCMNLGFQLSFLSTAAILFFYSPVDVIMQKLFRKRVLFEAVEMNFANQSGYILLTYFRQGISLTLAVLIVALPVTLFYFHKFPLMSLPYNLFFPFLVSISMLLLLLGCLFDLVFVGWIFHGINRYFTDFVLSLTYNIPRTVDMWIRVDDLEVWMVVCYLSLLLGVGIFAKHWLSKRKEEIQDYAFI